MRLRLLGANLFKAGQGSESLLLSRDELHKTFNPLLLLLTMILDRPYASSGTSTIWAGRCLSLRSRRSAVRSRWFDVGDSSLPIVPSIERGSGSAVGFGRRFGGLLGRLPQYRRMSIFGFLQTMFFPKGVSNVEIGNIFSSGRDG